MRKSDKKIDNELRKILTGFCENLLEEYKGFQWLTHKVNYSNFPASLKVICVFNSSENLALFLATENKTLVEAELLKALSALNIRLKDASKHLFFDSEENCTRVNGGDWSERLGKL